ncbi:CpXC domain-containing protein [Natrarchaeobius oligotrophus]|uniref:Uncharacterized protein n=1 Tax=Natrarchaeobius chitinivorans TaxID=1679083 RepID=A0A3N6MP03_NATCH|nr:CpXC domain-containing protein [Natrarchaeobius chitinivorans]RQG96236.1 hypothetical protein EA472_20495 [Natrarchaeobius chitinivorans]
MSQRVVCPHCSESTYVDIKMTVTRTSKAVGSLKEGFAKSATCSSCGEKFSCKTEW